MIRYAAVHNLTWLLLVPALAALAVYAFRRRRRALELFVGASFVPRWAGALPAWPDWIKAACRVAAAGLIILALAEPQWGKVRAPHRAVGRDIFIAIDVSRSMLAEDVVPNRLERAKADVRDLVAAVEQSGGHRVGLIAFAGTATVKCPLTQVYSHFVRVLDGLEPRSVAVGGSMIGDCIREATAAFDEKTQNFRDLILISDGEDMDSFPTEAAEAARDAGITIYGIGVGDAERGAEIPITDRSGQRTFLEHDGQVVLSKLHDQALREMARITEGIYVPAGTRAIELDEIFREYIEPKTKREMAETTRERWLHRFQWFLAPAVLLWWIDYLWLVAARTSGSAAARLPRDRAGRPVAKGRQSLLPATALLLASLAPPACADDARTLVQQGNQLYDAGKYAEAAERYERAAALEPNSVIPLYNRAAALYQSGEFAQAVRLYEQARGRAPEQLRQRIPFAIGNSHLRQALESQDQPQAALEQAKSAVRFFRDAITGSPANGDAASLNESARYNMEIAKRLIQQLQQQPPPPSQPNPQDQQDQSQPNERPPSKPDPSNAGERDETPRDAPRKPGEQSSSQPGDKDESEPQTGSAREQLSQEEAEQQLRAAIARAQAARARRLTESKKQSKAKAVSKDW